FSALCRRQKTLNVSLPYRGGTGPLNLLIDSTGSKAEGEGASNARKHGGLRRRVWRKRHIHCPAGEWYIRREGDRRRNTGGSGRGDHDQKCRRCTHAAGTAEPNTTRQDIRAVTADGACDTRKCRDAITARNAHTVIPLRKNAKPCKPTSADAVARNEAVNASRSLGKALRRRLAGYHHRSRVESKMNCIKLLGQSVMARDFDRQVAEIQIRIAVRNRYTALGIPVTEAVG
ncbi:DDE family transposase, partial [Salipiger aestuarii]